MRDTRRIVGRLLADVPRSWPATGRDAVVKPYADRRMRIPYGSLVPRQIDNLLVAGRCMSAEPDAMVQLRLIPVCFATGQAAGTAAALAARRGGSPQKVDVTKLQARLLEQGVDLGVDQPAGVSEPG